MSSWHSYPKVYNLGHAAVSELFEDPVVVEEKLDGSQFSFGIHGGELKVRSKGREFHIENPDDLFKPACETVQEIQDSLQEGWTYRGEAFKSRHHNHLTYDRVPEGKIALFDIEVGDSAFLSPEEKHKEFERLGLEFVPVFYEGEVDSLEQVKEFMEQESFLGGPKIEGMVFKNYQRFDVRGHALMGKYVSSAFREAAGISYKKKNPTSKDILNQLTEIYRTQARWDKAIQHRRDDGELLEAVQDIGPLCKEIVADVREECEGEIKDYLFKWAWPHLARMLPRGFAEYYKDLLAEKQFSKEVE